MSSDDEIKIAQEVEVVKPNEEMLEILHIVVLTNQQIIKALCSPLFLVKDVADVAKTNHP